MRKTIIDIKAAKNATPIVALTAYTAPITRLVDKFVDILLVGDSLGMVIYGMESTLPVSLGMMINHGLAVVKSSSHAFVVVDMPFGSYQESKEVAFNACAKVIKETGCQAVKIEGGSEMAETIDFLVKRAIPVIGHIALMPQFVNALGGYRYQGRNNEEREKIMQDALAVEKAGAFAIVLEGVEESLAREITTKLTIPTIGIGASAECDGQVLVIDDILGLTPKPPKFAKQFVDISKLISDAAESFASVVRSRKFPDETHCFFNKN